MKTTTIKRGDNIGSYTDLHGLFSENMPEFLEDLSEDELLTLDHVLDFEDYSFLVINYKTIVVICSDEITGIYTEKQFADMARQLITENE